MTTSRPLALGIAASFVFAASPALAWHHRHAAFSGAPAFVYGPSSYPAYDWQAEAIARATARMQAAPGVTYELSPYAEETATGGPSGGVPGFSGH